MKPESLKCLLNCYLREKFSTSQCDDVDGIYADAQCAGEPISVCDDRLSEFLHFYPEQAAVTVPQLYNEPLSPEEDAFAREFGRQLSQMSDEFERGCSRSQSFDSQPEDLGNSCVQFRNRCIFVSPNQDRIQIIIVRIGDADEVVKVKWETMDGTAKAGVHYHASGGDITFAEGEMEKAIEVEIVRNQRDRNINFTVNLLNPEGIEIGSDNPLTVYIADHSNFVPVERQIVDNIMNCPPNASVSEIAVCLHDELSVNTFRTALQYRCSYYDCVPEKLAFAFELVRLSVGKAPLETLGHVVSQFFSHLPELEDLAQLM